MEGFALIIARGRIMIASTGKKLSNNHANNRVLSRRRAAVSHISWSGDAAILNYANGTPYYSHTPVRSTGSRVATGWNSPRSSQSDSSDKTRRGTARRRCVRQKWKKIHRCGGYYAGSAAGNRRHGTGLPKLSSCTFIRVNITEITGRTYEIIFSESCKFRDA